MALSKIDVANMVTGAVPVANGGTALTSGFVNGRTNDQGSPIIVNGDMAVAQRSSSTVAQADDSNEGYATVDRFAIKFSNAAGGTITTSRDNTTTTGFGQSMKLNVTSADTSVASTHVVNLQQSIEAQVIRNSGWDYTSSSSYITLSFQIRSSKTGTYCIYVQTVDGTSKMYTAEYTISSADTWEQKVIAIPGDSGISFDDNAEKGLNVAWVLAVGSGRSGSAGSWTTGNAFGTSNQVNFLDNTSNVAYITGVQLEVGQFTSSTLPAFQHESFGDNLARCQRYFNILMNSGTERQDCLDAHVHDNDTMRGAIHFPVEMRSAPSVTSSSSGSADHWRYISTGLNTNYGSAITMNASTKSAQFSLADTGGSDVSGNAKEPGSIFNNTTSCFLKIDAEL
jgi:hypothetical protein